MKLSKDQQAALGIPPVSEAEFTRQVLGLAKLHGWRSAHFRPARMQSGRWATPVQGDGKGFPDLILLRGWRGLAVELKVGRNKPTAEQEEWLAAFDKVQCVYPKLWRPEHWPMIAAALSGGD